MNPLYPQVARRAEYRCEYCRAPEAIFNFSFEVEHIIPASADGSDAMENLALACRSCNAFKGYRQYASDPQTLQRVPLFHPRRDIWAEHFVVDLTTMMILGITPIGRATIAQLQINSQEQQQARTLWRQLDRFP